MISIVCVRQLFKIGSVLTLAGSSKEFRSIVLVVSERTKAESQQECSKVGQNDQFKASFSVKTWHKASLNNIHSKPYDSRTPIISSYNIFPEMDQIQEKKTTKSTIRNMSKNSCFIPSLSHLQKPYDNHYETQV